MDQWFSMLIEGRKRSVIQQISNHRTLIQRTGHRRCHHHRRRPHPHPPTNRSSCAPSPAYFWDDLVHERSHPCPCYPHLHLQLHSCSSQRESQPLSLPYPLVDLGLFSRLLLPLLHLLLLHPLNRSQLLLAERIFSVSMAEAWNVLLILILTMEMRLEPFSVRPELRESWKEKSDKSSNKGNVEVKGERVGKAGRSTNSQGLR